MHINYLCILTARLGLSSVFFCSSFSLVEDCVVLFLSEDLGDLDDRFRNGERLLSLLPKVPLSM